MQIEELVNSQKRVFHLAALAGAVYIVFGLLEITAYFYQVSIDYIQLILYTAIGIGLLVKHAWSRTLAIIVSAFTLLLSLLAFVFYRQILWTNLPVTWGRWYAVAQIVVQGGILCILLRSDVQRLFLKKDT